MDEKKLKYTETHEWIFIEGNIGTVGITFFAQEQLGDITFVKINDVGSKITKKNECGSIDSIKTISDVYAPLSGEITEINSLLDDQPELLNKEPFGSGWLFKMKISDTSEANSLMDYEAYKKFSAEAHH